MECCKCNKEVDIRPEIKANQYPPAKWFGFYKWQKLRAIICAECLSVPENKVWWRKLEIEDE